MPSIAVNGAAIHYERGGGNPAHPLVMIHGSGGCRESWPREMYDLEAACAIGVDMPGHGLSQGAGSQEVSAYAAFIEAFVLALGLSNVTLMGHSLGGAVALECALSRPPWLRGLILAGTGARLRVHPMILESIQKDYPAALALMDQFLFGPEASQELKARHRQIAKKTDPGVLLGDFLACNGFDVMERLAEISLPVLVIGAAHDRLTPVKYGRFLAGGLPGARMEIIQGAGHLMALEKPREFADTAASFFA